MRYPVSVKSVSLIPFLHNLGPPPSSFVVALPLCLLHHSPVIPPHPPRPNHHHHVQGPPPPQTGRHQFYRHPQGCLRHRQAFRHLLPLYLIMKLVLKVSH